MSRRLLSLLRRPLAEQWLLARTWVLLLGVRAALSLQGFPRVRARHERRIARAHAAGPRPRRHRRSTLAWAVRTAGRYVPSSKPCLTQALVLDLYLHRAGYPSRIAVGVARGERGLEAHAWIESEGRVVLGGEDLSRYTELRSGDPSGPFC